MLRVCRAATRMEMGYPVFFFRKEIWQAMFSGFLCTINLLGVYFPSILGRGGGITLEHALLASLFQKQIMSAVQRHSGLGCPSTTGKKGFNLKNVGPINICGKQRSKSAPKVRVIMGGLAGASDVTAGTPT